MRSFHSVGSYSSKSVRKKLAFYITMSLFIIIVSIGFLELFCTLFRPIYIYPADYFDNFIVEDDELGYKLANNFKGFYKQDFELLFSTNSKGLRDREFTSFPDEGTKRVLAIGDSWTFGGGVKLFQTWPKQLEKILEKKGIKSEVINTGVNGYSTRIYYRVLKKFYNLYHSDIVIVLVFSNDPGGDIADMKKIYSVITSNDGWLKKFLKRHSHLAKNLWFAYQTYFPRKYGNFHTNDIAKRDETDTEFKFAYELYRESLVNMKQFCQENNILFAVTTIPGDISFFLKFTEKVCKDEGIDYISQESLLGEDDGILAGVNSVGHYSPKGYSLLADNIAEYLSKMTIRSEAF